jgi:hypothetical protein
MRKLLITSCFVLLGVTGYQHSANSQIRIEVPGFHGPDDCDYRCQEHRHYEHERREQEARREDWRRDHRVDGDGPRHDEPRHDEQRRGDYR